MSAARPAAARGLAAWLAVMTGAGAVLAAEANGPGATAPPTIAQCQHIGDRMQRLECYDAATARDAVLRARDAAAPAAAIVPAAAPAAQRPSLPPAGGILGEWWGFDQRARDTAFEIRQYHANYIVAYGTNPFNDLPQTAPDRIYDDQPSRDPKGVMFQISAKARILARDDSGIGLWLAYTQQSWWQTFDGANSRPFRETDYQPEVILALRPEIFGADGELGGFAWRLLDFGIAHQSNGRSGNASRSWNRVYADAGFERNFGAEGQLALLARVWSRIGTGAAADDNPGITDYLGYGDLRAVYRRGDYLLTAMARGNLRTGKGAGEIAFAMPLVDAELAPSFPFKFYVQLFTGYGETLLDYNWRQTTVSVGFMLNDRR